MKNMYDIRMLCKVVNLHHSVYYYHKQNRKNSYKTANIELDKKIKEEFEKSKKRYGSPKITKVLNSQGIKVSQKRVARRMKELGLRSIIVKKFNHSGSKKVDDKNKEKSFSSNNCFNLSKVFLSILIDSELTSLKSSSCFIVFLNTSLYLGVLLIIVLTVKEGI